MGDRPAPIALDDLAFPTFPPSAREMLDGMDAMGAGVSLDADEFLAEARTVTGLDDFGADDGFFERLRVYLAAVEAEGQLTGAGRLTTFAQVQQILVNRLLATDFLARHPAVRDEAIDDPIIIVGLPRTGTTHLHNLMAADTNLRSLPYWESLEPVPSLAEQRGEQPDQRRDRSATGVWFLDETLPHFKRMHEMTVDHVHEEIQLLAIDLSTMLLETSARVPTYRDYYKTHDQQPSYDYMKVMLQICQYQRPGTQPTRWVLKSPQHLEQIPAIMQTFPGASVVFTHRDPVSVIVSFATMGAYTARLGRTAPIDLLEFGTYWRDRILDLYAAATRDRHLVPASQSIDVHFDEFIRDDIAMVERVYATARQPFTGGTRRAMDEFMAANPRGKHGSVQYDLAQFGLDASEIHASAAEYIAAFNVRLEDTW